MSQGGTQIAVAVIGLVGVVSAAALANYDDIFGSQAAPAPAAVQPSPTATAAEPESDTAEASLEAKNHHVENTAVLERVATQIRDSANADISGGWRDADGYVYSVSQQDGDYAFQQYQDGVQVSAGQGLISGRTLRHGFASIYGPGECVGQVAPDGGSIEGMCGNGASQWPFRITR